MRKMEYESIPKFRRDFYAIEKRNKEIAKNSQYLEKDHGKWDISVEYENSSKHDSARSATQLGEKEELGSKITPEMIAQAAILNFLNPKALIKAIDNEDDLI